MSQDESLSNGEASPLGEEGRPADAAGEPAVEGAEAAEGEQGLSEEEAEARRHILPEGMDWYVVHVYSGFEKTVQTYLNDRIAHSPCRDLFGEVMVPTEEVMDVREGRKVVTKRKVFPGYVLVGMAMNDETWYLVKNTPKVTGFLGGSGNRPTPISPEEVKKIFHSMKATSEKPKPMVEFMAGQSVRVVSGPFADYTGVVEEINYERSKLRIAVPIFGRETPLEVDFDQVEKAG